jgi:N-acetylneuraminate synthase
MYGSDQAASLEAEDFFKLVRDIRTVESSFGRSDKVVLDTEVPIKKKLRKV